MSVFVQICTGLIFTVYGIYFLLRNLKKKRKETFLVYLVCIFVGVVLLGYAVCQII